MAIITEANEHDGNNPQRINGLNSNDALADASEPVNLRTGGTVPEVGNSHPPEKAGIIHEMTKTIIGSVIREQIP
ncbi:hypothetical protein LIER_27826 [Lithospermum erythrorhizon]|uniref:Uncharacterized protein n=1 Tax=Lithospermum erythrorhizon TaxID=34254 RepID=A0AAV3RGE2_LITER